MPPCLALIKVFRSNMTSKEEPKITSCKETDNWTCITFGPDLAKFGMSELEEVRMISIVSVLLFFMLIKFVFSTVCFILVHDGSRCAMLPT